MVYNKIIPIMTMIEKMLENKAEPDKILDFVKSSYPNLKKDVLLEDIKNCMACGLFACNHSIFVGDLKSEIMVVGESSSVEEEKTGIPFEDSAGKIVKDMFKAASDKINPRWNMDNIFLTNLVKCKAEENGMLRKPTLNEITVCRGFLDKEIELVKPKLIICVGLLASQTLIHPNFDLAAEHGKLFGDGPKYMGIYHQNYVHLQMGTDQETPIKLEMWKDIQLANEYLESVK